MANTDIVQRLFDELAAFEAGQSDVPALQFALVSHGSALEGMPRDWHSRLRRWDGELELAIFTQEDDAKAITARRVIQEVRQALGEGAGPAEPAAAADRGLDGGS
jgi:hypothetical protein